MWKSWKKWIFQISIEKRNGNTKEQTWFSLFIAPKIWKCGYHGKNGKNGFFRFQLKRNMEMLKNKHGLVHQLLRKYGSVEIMEDMEKVDFQISIEQKYHLFGKYGSFGVQCQGFEKC